MSDLPFRVVSEEEIQNLLFLAGDDFAGHSVPETLWHLVEEVRRHRADARARWQVPPLRGDVLSLGEMHEALALSASRHRHEQRPAREKMKQVIREVVHLREQLTRAQSLATNERDFRIRAMEECNRAKAEATLLREMLVTQSGKVAPVDKRSARWIEAEKRVSAAVDSGKDPSPEDMATIMDERLKSDA